MYEKNVKKIDRYFMQVMKKVSKKKIQIFQTDYEKSVIFFTNISKYKEKKKKEKKIEREENYAPTAFSPAVLFR